MLFEKKMVENVTVAIQFQHALSGNGISPETVKFGQINQPLAVRFPIEVGCYPLDGVFGEAFPEPVVFVHGVNKLLQTFGNQFRFAGGLESGTSWFADNCA